MDTNGKVLIVGGIRNSSLVPVGEVEWIELLPLLEESAYAGWTTVVRTQGDDKPGEVARGVQFLNNVGMS